MTKDSLGAVLDRLSETIAARKGADPKSSYTAQLLARGAPGAARKFGEEAIEAILAASTGETENLAEEAGDALYHLLVLLAAADVAPEKVAAVLAAREGTSGLAEKAARGEG